MWGLYRLWVLPTLELAFGMGSSNTIKWDFKNLKMEFMQGSRRFTLRGIKSGKMQLMTHEMLPKALKQAAHLFMTQWIPETEASCLAIETGSSVKIPTPLQHLLQEYWEVFQDPTCLPPARGHFDHKIPLKEGTSPINLRPYRYPLKQKDIIEQLVQEMLSKGIIQISSSPFASPVVLVGKKDGSWRLCVDYRELNKHTVKDKFPIPVIEELLDELAGSTIYSKIDLKSGYHQVRMNEGDIAKTAFKTHFGHFEFLVMPFGLTNAPATFQSLMNHVFKEFLRKFVLVFFDDILIYSKNLQQHIEHVKLVLQTMKENELFAKLGKCQFGIDRVEYLGHYISGIGVETDPKKIAIIINWPIPANQKELRSFLGLTGYYRRFIQGYATICRPLTDLLRKDGFHWDSTATKAFEKLKEVMTSAPVLALPDFDQPFEIETDASSCGIGAVLQQNRHPIAFISKKLGPRWQKLSVYEKELLAIVFAVQKWEQYLIGRPFVIKTDQKSLKHLLEQRISTPFQQFWLAKLMGFDYIIQYKSGTENIVADALSRVQGTEFLLMALSTINSDLLTLIEQGWSNDPILSDIIQQKQCNPAAFPKYQLVGGQLRRKGKLVIGNDPGLRQKILQWIHASPTGGHSGRDTTLKRLKQLFFWKGMNKDVQKYIRECVVCQACKYTTNAPYGLLQPLPIPKGVWEDISMDFVDGLPKSLGKEVIWVVVDRLSKYAHFVALSHPYSAETVAQAYMDNIFRLHGIPKSIVSDRDAIFLSTFWQSLFTTLGVDLHLSSAYHPQTDGQTEVVNRCLEQYLRCMCQQNPKEWLKWLPLAEYWYNTSFHSAAQLTPFEVLYNQPPPCHLPYLPGESDHIMVDRSMQAKEAMIKQLQQNLLRAQHRMKMLADQHRTEKEMRIGDWVWLKLQPYRQTSVASRGNMKLGPKYFGPFMILDKVGPVAYKLALPPEAMIHSTVHISQLKSFHGQLPHQPYIPEWMRGVDAEPALIPYKILARRMVKRQNRPAVQYLIQWKHHTEEQATWMFADVFEAKYPTFSFTD